MNPKHMTSQWDQIKGRAKAIWNELADNDFRKADGSVDKLHSIIEERFGDSREAIRAKLDKFRLK